MRDELLAALGYWNMAWQPAMKDGVKHLPDIKADVFFITLNKTEKDYPPTAIYEDDTNSEDLFHWQS